MNMIRAGDNWFIYREDNFGSTIDMIGIYGYEDIATKKAIEYSHKYPDTSIRMERVVVRSVELISRKRLVDTEFKP